MSRKERGREEEEDLSKIQTPYDEFIYWSTLSEQYQLKAEVINRAQAISDQFKDIKPGFADLSAKTPLSELVELIELTQDALDNIWRLSVTPPYSENRIEHLMQVISSSLVSCVVPLVINLDPWTHSFDEGVKESLNGVLDVCSRWVNCTYTLTYTFWPNYDSHKWLGKPFSDDIFADFTQRLQDVLTIRSVYEQMIKLLPAEERPSNSPFSCFNKETTFAFNDSADADWRISVREYDRTVGGMEQKAAQKLRKQLGSLASQPTQLLAEFNRYKHLVKRPAIAKELAQEREVLLGQLTTYVNGLREDFESKTRGSNAAVSMGKNLPEVVNSIVWARQLINKVESTTATVEQLLGELPKVKTFLSSAAELLSEMRSFQNDQFASWGQETTEALRDSSEPIALQMSGRIMELDYSDGTLKVNYSERLVTLLREVRQLMTLGFKIPSKIREAADVAQKFYRHGMVLKQVANFYNTIHTQMIPSQNGMLVDAAKQFEQLVKTGGANTGKKGVTWDSPADVEAYIDRLQKSAEKITSENRKLRKIHGNVASKVAGLLGTDLLKSQDKWKDQVREIRAIMDALEAQGYKNMKAWRTHWDYQLYKVLEFQYQKGLESLNENLTEINVELIFKQQKLQFRPSFEIVRSNYYSAMRNFINFPLTFGGVGDTDIFKFLPDRNAASLGVVYKKAEELFIKLLSEKDQFYEWVILGTLDLDEYVDERMQEVHDWELNFKMLKARGREAEKLPSEKKIDCITLSFLPVRLTIDDLMQRLADTLVSSLRKSVLTSMSELEKFLDEAIEELSVRPSNVDEISKSNLSYRKIADRKTSMRPLYEKCDLKNKLLLTVGGGGVTFATVQSKWENLELSMEYHEMMVKEQISTMKSDIDSRLVSFNTELLKFTARWSEIKPKKVAVQDKIVAVNTLALLKEIRQEFDEIGKTAAKISEDCKHFDMQVPTFPGLDTVEEDIFGYEQAWQLYERFSQDLEKLSTENWNSFRAHMYALDDFASGWIDQLKGKPKDSVVLYLRDELDRYKNLSPLLKHVRGDSFTPDHWMSLYKLLDIPREVAVTDLTLGHFIGASKALVDKGAAIKELASRAEGEVTIRKAMQELKVWASDTSFTLIDHIEHNRTTPLIKEWRELMTSIGDNQSLLNSLKDSPYYKLFGDEARNWEIKLGLLDEYLQNLNQIQRRWVYLEPIFARGALPQEQARFRRVDDEFRTIMIGISKDTRVSALTDIPGLKDTLHTLLDQLERCQKALSDFLEEKRSRFPRFYFIGDDDLLEILGQAQNPAVIQTHLKKLFAGIHSVDFTEDNKKIIAMKSLQGEVVSFSNPVVITDQVEVWMSLLSDEMKNTLKNLLVQCIKVQKLDLSKFPSQILCTAESIHFTQQCEAAIQGGSLEGLMKDLRTQLQKYTSYDVTDDVVLNLKLKALVLDIIHNIDVVEQLQRNRTNSINGWMWTKQLRFYLDKDKCMVHMGEGKFHYTYEYQGNAPKLVHTPLTDKCYLTLTQGIMKGYGGNPYGPAGTGKTESVKALGQALGRQVLVFNCDEGIDFKSMGRIFAGLVKCGAWGCFDEFNRLDEEVLSAVSQQIQVIQAALKEQSPKLELLGKVIDLDPAAGIFVTLNPAGKGYGGRSKLPDNLKQLFRSVAMSAPDLEQISEVILYSEGFVHAREIGKKLVSIFTLSKQLLTQQQHYDWGLRALKTVLSVGGQLVQATKRESKKIDLEEEKQMIIKALRVNTLSKLTFADSHRFKQLISDVFSGDSGTDVNYPELEASIIEVMKEMKLKPLEAQTRKILQFYENCKQRMGVVIVGPSGCGKSTIWRVLKSALARLGKHIRQHTINPKALPRTQLLGHMDLDTREWFDGILTASARQVVKAAPHEQEWIVCDGDIDPEWVESLNSVLDDNRLLTLPNGERIQFGPNVNFIFETHNLIFASPATVSRMGMIFLSDEDMDTKALLSAWLAKQTDEVKGKLTPWIDDIFHKALAWVLQEGGTLVVETTKVGLVLNGLSHLHGVTRKGEFVLGLIRGLGGNLTIEKRTLFAKEVFNWASENPPDRRKPLGCFYNPDTSSLRSYEPQPSDFLASDLSDEPMVRTIDVQANLDLIMPCIRNMEPFILVGPEGCGKNMLLKNCFSQLRSTSVATIHCSSQTMAQHIIQKLHQACSVFTSNTGRVLRPRDSERLILYLKDLNLPKPDKYDTIQLIAFLQQLITYNGFYDDRLEWVGLEKIQIVASMNPATTVGRHALSTRFTAIARIFAVNYPEREQLISILTAYLSAALIGPDGPCRSHQIWKAPQNISKLAQSMVDVYDEIRNKFSVDDYSHYLFTPRDLTKWVLGLMRYDLESQSLLDVWTYEANRIFRDRLVGTQSVQRFDRIIAGVLKSQWDTVVNLHNVRYTTWAFPTTTGVAKKLGTMSSEDFKAYVAQGIVTYEREYKELHMLLFDEILDHIARVDRVLSKNSGSLLMVGRSGVGRLTAVTLVAHLHRMKVFSPNMSRNYSLKAFRNDLKNVLQVAGVAGEPSVLVLEDHQFIEPNFVEYVNSLLAAGEIPGLYSPEELDQLLAPLKDQLSQEGFRGGLFGFFVSRVKQNLRIVLVMDPQNKDFMIRCESNPALYTQCAIQWWESWSNEGMTVVAKMVLHDILENMQNQDAIVNNLLHIHESCLGRGGTPRSYITLLNAYKRVFEAKRKTLEERRNNLQGGLSKLSDAANHVDSLSTDAEKKRKLVTEKKNQADQALVDIQAAMDTAAAQREEMKQIQSKLAEEEKVSMTRKGEVEVKLSKIQPVLDEAKTAVGQIKSENLYEIKSLKTPSQTISNVLEGVLMLMGIYDTSWNSMKTFLGQRNVKEQILNFDAHNITPEIRAKVEDHLERCKNSFEAKTIMHASVAAAPLAAWVKANLSYSSVLESVAPLERELEKANKSLEKSRARVQKLQRALDRVDNKVATLRDDFAKRTTEMVSLQAELDRATEILTAAEALIGKLGSERDRWVKQVEEMSSGISALPLHTLLAAGFITYLGNAPEDTRTLMLDEWKNLCKLPDWTFLKFMSSESEMLALKAEGLPADDLSMQNAIILINSQTTPYIVDPSTQATEWLKTNLEKANAKMEVVNQQDPRFNNTLELAVRFGKTLVIQEADQIEPVIYPLIRKDLIRQGPRWVVQIGDKTIDYNEEFKLYLVTRNPTPDIMPDAASLINEVNFTVTRSGLEGQLLGATIQHEKPDLETKKKELLLQEEEQKLQLADLEKSLLTELASSEGNILQNKQLLLSLNETKSKSLIIAQSLAESSEIQRSLDQERDAYRPIAGSGSSLYFLISDLAKVNHMYQFSLNSFLPLFKKALGVQAEQGAAPKSRIQLISNAMQKLLYDYVSRSLFKSDKLMFGMHLVHIMNPSIFQHQEWELFIGRIVAGLDTKENAADFPAWANSDRKAQFSLLSSTLPALIQGLSLKDESWNAWAKNAKCETEFPQKFTSKTSAFQKVLLVQALRPDKLESAMVQFVCEALGVKSLAGTSLNLPRLMKEETTPTTPVLLVTTPGADPSQELEEFAEKAIGKGNYRQVAMGQGQAELALATLRDGAKTGLWVTLKNLHLATSWLPVLEKELLSLSHSGGVHDNFRLWLTTEPHQKFSPILLQGSLKITYEAPPGIKKNLMRTYDSWGPEYLNGSVLRAQTLFVLAWFHAIIQERRRYIPQAWTKFYEFSFADLRAGSDVIESNTQGSNKQQNANVDWQSIQGLLENAIYGGRVDNEFDIRVLRAYLTQYFNADQLNQKTQRKLARNVGIPTTAKFEDYTEIINNLPDSETPETFGLPANIERSVQRANSTNVISQLKVLEVTVSEGTRFNREQWATQLSPIIQLWQKLVSGNDVLRPETSSSSSNENPIELFISMETEGVRKLVHKINASLSYITKVISGSLLLTPNIQAVGTQLLRGEVPSEWSDVWEGPANPFTWLRQLVSRAGALDSWKQRSESGKILQSTLNLSDLFRPDTFLNAFRQQTARTSKRPIDSLRLVASWDSRFAGKAGGIAVEGLLLQGCNFDGEKISDSYADAPEIQPVPKCTFAWLGQDERDPYPEEASVLVPLYSTASREKLVSQLLLPCSVGERAKWVVAGVALFLSEN